MFQELQSVIFSELVDHNSDVVTKLSPKGDMFASASQSQLLIWHIEGQDVCHNFICDHLIESVEWSPDSELIYCCMCKSTVVQIWNLLIPSWRCRLVESPLAFIDILWAPDSRHLLVVSEFHIKIKIWSLVSITTSEIENVKPVKNCISFSSCEQYLAVAERIDLEDLVAIYTCETWEILKSFPVETKDLSGIDFSPCDLVIAVLEAPLQEFKVLFYSVDGRLLSKYDRTSLFGITSLSWNQSGKTIALGSYSGEITVLNGSTYQEIASYQYPETVESEDTVVYRVVQRASDHSQQVSKDATSNCQLYKVEKARPVSVSPLVTPTEKNKCKDIKYGMRTLKWSADSQYIASMCGNQPHVLCIYDMKKLELASIVIHCQKIKNLSWHAENPILAICTGSSSIDMWTPSCCISIFSPFKDEFAINIAKWSKSRNCLVLNGKDKSSVLNLP